MSLGPIPWTAQIKYTEFYRLDRDIAEAFVDIISDMDEAYMGYQAEEQERTRRMSKNKKKT